MIYNGIKGETVPYNGTIKTPEAPSAIGYEFVGWTKTEGSKNVDYRPEADLFVHHDIRDEDNKSQKYACPAYRRKPRRKRIGERRSLVGLGVSISRTGGSRSPMSNDAPAGFS